MTFTNRIREIRAQRGLSQKQLAALLNVSQGAVHYWETGLRDVSIDLLRDIADALECEAWELLPKDMQPRAIFYCGALSDLNQLLEEEDGHKTTKTGEGYITVTTCRNDRNKPRLH